MAIFHHSLSWISHIFHVWMGWWGAAHSTLLTLYKSPIHSHLEYSSIILGKCPKATPLRLDRIQYKVIKTTLGLMRSTSINEILSEGVKYQYRFNTKIPQILKELHNLRTHLPRKLFLFLLHTFIVPINIQIVNHEKSLTNKKKMLHTINTKYRDYCKIYTEG